MRVRMRKGSRTIQKIANKTLLCRQIKYQLLMGNLKLFFPYPNPIWRAIILEVLIQMRMEKVAKSPVVLREKKKTMRRITKWNLKRRTFKIGLQKLVLTSLPHRKRNIKNMIAEKRLMAVLVRKTVTIIKLVVPSNSLDTIFMKNK